MSHNFPKTRAIREHWSAAVEAGKTDASFDDWLGRLTPEDYLSRHGLIVRRRDQHINSNFEGAWQVSEHYEVGTKTRDGSDGPWAIVGDDRHFLIEQTIEHISAWWPMHRATRRQP